MLEAEMSHSAVATIYILSLALGSVGLLELGRRTALRRLAAGEKVASYGVVEGAMFGLLGLLIAFSFSAAAGRFERRRTLIVEEANAIGTAYLRLDLLPPEAQPPLRADFRRYVDSRLAVYEAIPDVESVKERLARSSELQREIWARAVDAARTSNLPQALLLIVPALNDMIDITTTRTVALQTHTPQIVFVMLSLVVWVCSLLAGFSIAAPEKRSHLHVFSLAGIFSLTVFVIIDYEYPRVGFVRINATDQVLVDLRDSMK